MSLSESGQLKLPRVLASELRASYPIGALCIVEDMHRQRDGRSTGQFGCVERTKKKKTVATHLFSRIFAAEPREKRKRRRVRNLVEEERDGGELCGILYIKIRGCPVTACVSRDEAKKRWTYPPNIINHFTVQTT